MHEIILFDETLDINLTQSYHISIQADLDGFSFCILDVENHKYLGLRHIQRKQERTGSNITEQISTFIRNDELLNQNYKSAGFLYSSSKSTLVPYPLFSKDNLKSYFSFNHSLNPDDIILYNKLKNTDAYNIFTIPEELLSVISESFPNIRFYHQATPFIESILSRSIFSGKENKAFVNVKKNSFEIAVIQSNNLELYNSFFYKNDRDFIFFIMYIYDKLKLSPEQTPITLSGNIDTRSDLYQILKKFIKSVTFEKYNEYFAYSYPFNNILPHAFNSLLNLYLCE